MSTYKFSKDDVAEARARLRKVLKVGTQVHVVQRHVSRSGMERRLSLFVVKGGRLIDITRDAAAVTGFRFDTDDWTVKVGGCGMDMHFHTVYSLARAMWPKGHPCTGDRKTCNSNDHSNDYGTAQRDYYAEHPEDNVYYDAEGGEEAHARMRAYVDHRLETDLGYRKGRKHSDGGYALDKRTI